MYLSIENPAPPPAHPAVRSAVLGRLVAGPEDRDAPPAFSVGLMNAATAPDALLSRAVSTQLREFARRQAARETVARIAEQAASGRNQAAVDPAWMNAFVDHVERAHGERALTLWGMVLAGEMLSPGSFSVHAMRLLAELPARTIGLFATAAAHSLNDVVFQDPCGFTKPEAVALEAAGLIAGGGDTFNLPMAAASLATVAMEGEHGLGASLPSPTSFGVYVLTPVGLEWRRLVSSEPALTRARRIAAALSKGRPGARFHVLGAVANGAAVLETI
ncbi:MAG: DUF2806 domain-containing protein [Caulobacter sp.]